MPSTDGRRALRLVPGGIWTRSTVIAGHMNFADGSPGALEPLAKITKGTAAPAPTP
ncbi:MULTISPECIES: hypothetical protein [unclassified Arthrobacter]|uniref:hypothetical protein n=1 Tax=unclassified Arthrobacter TaxID=235627 RepID=UPI001E386A13|nr:MULTISPECIES: hypothetical protein [unclassified Arthrobacter]MCC9146752.1 hypothetical protein [Arthrobacter sp. zg-Y919]MDK1277983.1 hypothetical protein [Arthrobacter sp. zg.Y919]WIB03426.1 hypothetical protein QNO10_01660 [Arthrobacter sp. zg-Y919]